MTKFKDIEIIDLDVEASKREWEQLAIYHYCFKLSSAPPDE